MGSVIPMHGIISTRPCVLAVLWLIEHCSWCGKGMVRAWEGHGEVVERAWRGRGEDVRERESRGVKRAGMKWAEVLCTDVRLTES